MKQHTRMLITGAGPDALNHNTFLRSLVTEGFAAILGDESVSNISCNAAGAAIKDLSPEFVLCFGSAMPDASFLEHVANTTHSNGGVFGVWLHDDPYELDFRYRATSCADIIYSNDFWAASHYEHDRAFHLPLAASPTHHYRHIDTRRINDLYFCGAAFPNRIDFFRHLPAPAYPVHYLVEGPGWPSDISYATQRRVDNDEVADSYSRSLAVINIGRHFDLANTHYALTASTPGPRTFEAAMAGTVQLFIVESLEILQYFSPTSEILLVDSVSDVPDIISYLRTNDDAAHRIACAAQARALREHTYANRAARALALLHGCLGVALETSKEVEHEEPIASLSGNEPQRVHRYATDTTAAKGETNDLTGRRNLPTTNA